MAKSIFKSKGFWIAIIIAVGLIYLAVPKASSGEYDGFAECLTERGATMYGTDWCPHCKNQKALFGGSFSSIDYVNCDFEREECASNGVRGYPTWKVNLESHSGVQSLEKLSALTGCELVKDAE